MMNNEKLHHDISNERTKAAARRHNQSYSGSLEGLNIEYIYDHLAKTAIDTLKFRISNLMNIMANGNHFRAALNRFPKTMAEHHIFGSNIVINCIRDLYIDSDGTAAHIVFQLETDLSETKPVIDFVAVLKEDINAERVYTWGEVTWLLVIADTLGKLLPEFRDSHIVALKNRGSAGIDAGDIVDGKKWANLFSRIEEQIKVLNAIY